MLIDHVYQRFHQKVAANSQLPLLGRCQLDGYRAGSPCFQPSIVDGVWENIYFTTIIIVRVMIMVIINLILLTIVLIVIVYILLYDWL